MNYINFGNSAEEETRRKIHKMIKVIKDITCYTQLKELKLDRFHLRRIVAIIQNKNEEEIYQLISFISKWRDLYSQAESDPITLVKDFFHPNDIDNFNVVFTIGLKYYIYSTGLNTIFVSL